MKKVLFALLLAAQSFWATEATAAPCVTASLASYQALGSGGCTIGTLLFTDFSLNGLSTGATDFPGIVVNPGGSGPDAGLDFTFTTGANDDAFRSAFIHTNVTAPTGTTYENRIGFKVTGTTVNLSSSTIRLNGAGATNGGTVTTVQDLCLGGTFVDPANSPVCSPGSKTGSQIVAFDPGFPDLAASTLAFAPVAFLSVINDIVVDAGPPGSTAMLASLSSLFSSQPRVVPEPESLLLIGAGLMALLMRRRRSTPNA